MTIRTIIDAVIESGAESKAGAFLRQLSTNFTRISRATGEGAMHSSVSAFIKYHGHMKEETPIMHMTINASDERFAPFMDTMTKHCGGLFRAEPRTVPGARDQKDRVESYIACSGVLSAILSTDGLGTAKNVTFIVGRDKVVDA